jgi:predicted N-formylglutamate amidohydrolase
MSLAQSAPLPHLLGADDPPAAEICNAVGAAPLVITCDHASVRVPRALAGLGLPPGAIERHIGWDIGAAAVTRLLAPMLGAPAILSGYSRLVVDCNRDPEDASSIPEASDGVAIPGNRAVAVELRAARLASCFAPYHAAIAAQIAWQAAAGRVPALLSIHSFTPLMNGVARPWHVGVLWDKDPRIAVPLLAALRADPALSVGDNEPYSAREPAGYTVRHHAARAGLPHVALELRQDLVATADGAVIWAARLAAVLQPILARDDLYRLQRY